MRLIDADALIEFASNHVGGMVDCNDIARFPTVDAVEVVRCKDCKRWCALDCDSNYGTCSELTDRYREDCESSFDETTRFDDFCSHGERKVKDA